MHPPDVIGELAAAEAALETQTPGSLRITSAPSGCPVFIQGRNLGQTPLELPRLSRGEYRVQVECVPGEYGRVHRVTLGPSRALVHVDSHFDTVVQSGDGVSLRYASDRARQGHARAHAIEVGRAVGANLVALVAPEPERHGHVRISALEVERGTSLGSVIVALGDDGQVERIGEAIAALRADRSLDFTVDPPSPVLEEPLVPSVAMAEASGSSPSAPAPREVVRHDGDAAGALEWTLAGAAVATHLVGWALYGRLLALEGDYRKVRDLDDSAEARRRLDRIDSFQLAAPLTAFAGSLLTIAALPLVLDHAGGGEPPAWSFALGGAGLAIAGTGAALLVIGSGCDDFDALGRCDDTAATTHLGAMVIATALPLLSIPIVHWLRGAGMPEGAGVRLEASHLGFAVHWRRTL